MSFKAGDIVIGKQSGRVVEVERVDSFGDIYGKVIDVIHRNPDVRHLAEIGNMMEFNGLAFKLYEGGDIGFEF